MSTSIPISELNLIGAVTSSDYIPIVQDSSVTTFRTQLATLANWISASVRASSSYSAISTSYALSSSYAQVGGSSSFALNLAYPNTSTASYAISASHSITSSYAKSASIAISASWSPVQNSTGTSTSASWASSSIWSISSSFASGSIFATSASWASQSLISNTSVSSSFASQSISSSFATTASYVISAGGAAGYDYPYIQEVQFWATHDDWIDISLLGTNNNSPGNGMTMGYTNSGTGYKHRFYWDDTNKVYTGGNAYSNISSPKLKIIRMWCDNRGGGSHNWHFTPTRYITASFALSPTQTVTQIYTASAGDYSSITMIVNAYRAEAGLNAIIYEYGTSAVFPGFNIAS